MLLRRVFALVIAMVLSIGVTQAYAENALTVTDMLNKVNDLRQSHGRALLTVNNALTAAAQEQADHISLTGNYAHTYSGSSPSSRALSAGYQPSGWCCSENTHRTQVGKSAWEFWNYSRAHYDNMLNAQWTEIGVATSNVGEWTGWVLVFAAGGQSAPIANVPTTTVSVSTAPIVNTSITPSSGTGSYQVAQGDTLFGIAQRHGTTVGDIKAANGLSSDLIYAGQILQIPNGQVAIPPQIDASPSAAVTGITSPASGAIMRGGFPIIGTANLTSGNEWYYKVEISGGQFGDAWVTVGDVHNYSVNYGQLEYLYPVQPGNYTLRLVIVGWDYNSLSSYTVSFTVQ